MPQLTSAFDLTAAQIAELLDPAAPLFPELEIARQNMAALKTAPQTGHVLAATEHFMPAIAQIPPTPYTSYRLFIRTGDRERYEQPYFEKRARLAAIALRLFLGQTDLKDTVQDYIWNICEETNWVLPAHEMRRIDLFSAETGLQLAETLNLLGNTLDAEIRHRVRQEVEERIFDPYLHFHRLEGWYKGGNNWNGVCNSSVASTFLLLEPEPGRLAYALEIAFAGLKTFLETAFEEDGSSTEGAGYWGYGLLNFVPLSEMLRSRSHGKIDLLQGEHMKRIAAYPPKMLLSGNAYASFSDCDETTTYNPGIITRLAERTGETTLLNLLTSWERDEWRLSTTLRNLLWWDGKLAQPTPVSDAYLPKGAFARLVTRSKAGAQVVVAVKAGHNAENHNQNDVGSFMIHAEGENLLTDPGRGLYSRQYFGPERYTNIFANSYGHSVPRIGGHLQKQGREYEGRFLAVDSSGSIKQARLELARAYPVDSLQRLERTLTLEPDGVVHLADTFAFSGQPLQVEEVFVTWLPVETRGSTAIVCGKHHSLHLTIEQPVGATFAVEELKEESEANRREGVLKRITFTLPLAAQTTATVRMVVEP